MITENQARDIVGSTAYTSDGEKLGKVGQLFLDDQTGQPAFVTVNTGLFGMNESYIPISDASVTDQGITVPYTKEKVKDAPNVDLNRGHLDEAEEQRLYEYYGMGSTYSGTGMNSGMNSGIDSGIDSGTDISTGTAGTTGTSGTAGYAETGTVGHDTSGPTTDQAMTRSEEHLEVGTARQEAGRVRLRKYVTSETETATVPVEKERAVVHTEPITDGNVDNALDGPAISEEEHEVVLHEERAVADTVAQPVERVRLDKETEVEQETVSGEVRKENIEVDGDADRTDRI